MQTLSLAMDVYYMDPRAAFTEFGPTAAPVASGQWYTAYAMYCTYTKYDFSALL